MKKATRRAGTGAGPRKSELQRRPPQPATWAIFRDDTGWFFAISAAAFLLRLVYLYQVSSIPLFYSLPGDPARYDRWAQAIVAGDWLGTGVFYQAPLYPYFLALVQSVVGHDLWWIRLIQLVLGSLSCGIIYLTAKALFGRPAGVVAGIILACYAPSVFFEALIDKPILDLTLLALFLFLVVRFRTEPNWKRAFGLGAVLGILGLSRENALILAVPLMIWFVIYFSSHALQSRFVWAGVFVGGALLVLLPVGLRNLAIGGEFTLTTAQFGANFFIGNNPAADGTYGSVREIIGAPHLEGSDAKRLAEQATGRNLTSGGVSSYWFLEAGKYIRSQTLDWLKLLGKKWLMVWNAREIEDSDDFYIYTEWSSLLRILSAFSHFGVLVPLSLIGVFVTRSRWRELWVFYAIALFFALSVAGFYVFGRYRFPLVPVLVLFAGAAFVGLKTLWDEQDLQALSAALILAVVTAVVVNWRISGVPSPGPGGYNNLANAYLSQGKIDKAIDTANKALLAQPSYGIAHYNLGNLYAMIGRLDLAQYHFSEAIRIYPNYAEARSNFGQLLAERGDLDSAMQHFRKAIELKPGLTSARLNLGVALAKASRVQEAETTLRDAVKLAPDSAEAHYALATVYAAEGRYDDSVKHLKEVVRIRWDFPQAHQSLAQVLALQGKQDEASQHYREALRLLDHRG